jgi:hypothetical protein
LCVASDHRACCLQLDFFGETTEGNLKLVQRLRGLGMVNVLGLNELDDIYDIDVQSLKATTQVRPHTVARAARWQHHQHDASLRLHASFCC